jgi:hypothetical protein
VEFSVTPIILFPKRVSKTIAAEAFVLSSLESLMHYRGLFTNMFWNIEVPMQTYL